MTQSWHDVVAILAGPNGEMSLTDGAVWDATFIAEAVVPGGLFRSPGDNEEAAWRGVAHSLGDHRLVEVLESSGWSEIDEVIDQVTYVVARDRDGVLWAIGVAAPDGDRRGYIESDIAYDGRTFDRVAFVEPIETRDWPSLNAALEAST